MGPIVPDHDMASMSSNGVDAMTLVLLAVAAGAAVGYLVMVHVQAQRHRRWSRWRTLSFLVGVGLVGWALWTPALPFEHGDLRQHMQQHLLIGMYAPLAIVMSAPLTLTFRSLSPTGSRRLGSVLRTRPMRVLGHPAVAVAMNLGGLVALYFTPLYGWLADHPVAHAAVHLHFLVAGCLFAWVIAGADPVPHRLNVPRRLVVVGVAVAGHAIVAQLVYGGFWTHLAVSDAQRRGAGDLMYFGGDIAELLLALAVVTTWRNVPSKTNATSIALDQHGPRWEQTTPLPATSR